MKKLKLVALVTLLSISPIFANSWEEVGNTCQNRVSFWGILTVWSGHKTIAEYDNFGEPTGRTKKVSCTSDGNWDWFW
jgi:hypothetical protein